MMNKILDAPIRLLKYLIGINMLGALALIFVNVILRTVGQGTIEWVEPLVVYLIMWTVFLGAGLIFSEDEHLSMGILYDFVPHAWKTVFDVFNIVLTTVISIFLIYFGFIVTRNLYVLGQMSMDGNIPLYLIMASIPIGAITAIYCITVNRIKNKLATGRKEDKYRD